MADQKTQYKESINSLAVEIKKISKNLNANKALLKTEKDKLSILEQKIINLDKKLVTTSEQIEAQKKENSLLNKQILDLETTHEDDRRALINLVRERYMRGEPNYLKMILNQENPYAVGRLANYLDYFTNAQKEKMDDLIRQAKAKQSLKADLTSNLSVLEGHFAQQKKHQTSLDRAKKSRRQSVKSLESKVSKTSVKLDQLSRDRKRLNNLLQQLAKQTEKLRKIEQARIEQLSDPLPQSEKNSKPVVRPLVKGGFLKQRGRLRYPVKGNVEYRFGNRIIESGMRAQGTFFATNGAQKVNSIFRGRVLFADYLKGYGLLLIIDHGDDHISLYGHNEVLYKQVGDQVNTNETVAKTGVTGGLKSHGLYFEIRKTAVPVNPAIWCQG